MAATIAPASLKSLLEGKEPFALIDVREAGEYNASHIPGASLIARRQLETSAPQAVPFKGTPIVVCDDPRAAWLSPGVGARRRHQSLGHRWARDRVGHERSQQGLRREGRSSPPRA